MEYENSSFLSKNNLLLQSVSDNIKDVFRKAIQA